MGIETKITARHEVGKRSAPFQLYSAIARKVLIRSEVQIKGSTSCGSTLREGHESEDLQQPL